MPIIRNFIRHTSPERLREYFDRKDIAVNDVDWSQDRKDIARNVIQLVDHLNPEQKARLQVDAERICHMADELGQAALFDAIPDPQALAERGNGIERSQWVYVNDLDAFRHAEDIRYADKYRFGRDWSAYRVPSDLGPQTDAATMASFKSKMRSELGLGEKVQIDHFERIQPDAEGNDVEVVQFMIYQEGMPDAVLEFDGDEVISRIRRPVNEYAIIYSPSAGLLEVTAARRERRNVISKAFTEDMLGQAVDAETVPLRRYSLDRLMDRRPLELDPADGIESAQVVMMRLQDLSKEGYIAIEVPARCWMGFHDYAENYLEDRNPLTCGDFRPVQARLSIRFQPENGSRRSKVLPIKITLPNGSDLKNRTHQERLIGEKYMPLWELISEED
jgi:hypothetical protein